MQRNWTAIIVLAFCLVRPLAAAALPANVDANDPGNRVWDDFLRGETAKAEAGARACLARYPKNYLASELLLAIARLNADTNGVFEHFMAMLESDRPETAAYVRNFIYQETNYPPAVWLSPAQLQRLEDKLRERLRSESLPPELRTAFRGLLAQVAYETGRLDAVKQARDDAGFIGDWMIIGGFDNSEGMGFDKIFPPEQAVDFSRPCEGAGWKIGWRRLPGLTLDGAVDFRSFLQPSEWSTAYAVVFIHTEREQRACLRIGSDDGMKLWWNDALALADPTYHGCQPDQHLIPVLLKPGWNKLLVKVCQGEVEWRLMARLTDEAGQPLSGVTFGYDPRVYVRPADPGLNAFAVPGLEAVCIQNAGSPRTDYHLAAWLRRLDRKQDAQAVYEKLMKAYPRCPLFFLEAGQIYLADGKPTKGLNALRKASELASRSALPHFLLGRQYWMQNLPKKAESELAAALQCRPAFPEALLYQAMLHDREGRPEEAYRAAKQAQAFAPSLSWANDSVAAFADKLGFQQEVQETYLKARQSNFGWFSSVWKLGDWFQKQGRYDEAIRQYQLLTAVDPYDLDSRFAVIDCRMKQKQYDQALEVCQEALTFSPDHFQLFTKMGLAEFEMGDNLQAQQHWQHALALRPDFFWLRNYMEKRFPEKNPLFEKYSVDSRLRSQLLAAPASAEIYPKASAVVLLDQEMVQAFDNGYSAHQIHRIVKILNENGRSQFGCVQLAPGENHRIKKAVTITPRGEQLEPTDIQNNKIAFGSLENGSIIEYQYTYDYFSPLLKGELFRHFAFQEGDAPVLYHQAVLALPRYKKLQVRVAGKIAQDQKTFQGQTVYLWTARNQEQVYGEILPPAWDSVYAHVRVSTLNSWDELGIWERGLVKAQLKTDLAIQDKVAELAASAPSREDKIRAAYEWVARQIRYLRRDDQMIFFWKPQRAENVFADGFGVCKDKAALLITMLRAMNINAEFALLLTRDQGATDPGLPMPSFNHAIVYLPPAPGEREGRFLDPTSEFNPYGNLWSVAQGVKTFVCGEQHAELLSTPAFPAEANQCLAHDTIRMDAQGGIAVDSHEQLTGDYALQVRYACANPAQRRNFLESSLIQDAAGAELINFDFKNLENLQQPVMLAYNYQAAGFAIPLGRRISFKPLYAFKTSEHYAGHSERHYDLELPGHGIERCEQTYEIPEGYRVASLPESLAFETPYARYECIYRTENRSITAIRTLTIKASHVPKERYGEWRQFCIQADAADQQQFILEKEK